MDSQHPDAARGRDSNESFPHVSNGRERKDTMYELQSADKETLRRTVEVVFYLVVQHIYDESTAASYENKQLIEALSEFFGCKPTTINMAYQNMLTLTHAPSPSERVIALKYLGLPIRKISKVTKTHPNTIYRYLKQYRENGEIGLAPRFDYETDRQLLKFNKQMFKTFAGLNDILNVREAEEVWK